MNEDPISRAAAIAAFREADADVMADYGEYYGTEWGFSMSAIEEILSTLPSVPPQVAHGRVLDNGNPICGPCSVCGKSANRKAHFCSECGAILDGGDGQ